MFKKSFLIAFVFALLSGCVIMYKTDDQKDENKKPDNESLGFSSQPIPPETYATVRPDLQPQQDYPTPANWEFYSQKGGTPLRRANADSVGKMFRPDIAELDTTYLNRFYHNGSGDTAFYKNFYGDSIALGLLSAPALPTIYTANDTVLDNRIVYTDSVSLSIGSERSGFALDTATAYSYSFLPDTSQGSQMSTEAGASGFSSFALFGDASAAVTTNCTSEEPEVVMTAYLSSASKPSNTVSLNKNGLTTDLDAADIEADNGVQIHYDANNGGSGSFIATNESGLSIMQVTGSQTKMQTGIDGDNFASVYCDTVGSEAFVMSIYQSLQNSIGFLQSESGGVLVTLGNDLPAQGKVLRAEPDGGMYFWDIDSAFAANPTIYTGDGTIPNGQLRQILLDTAASINILYPNFSSGFFIGSEGSSVEDAYCLIQSPQGDAFTQISKGLARISYGSDYAAGDAFILRDLNSNNFIFQNADSLSIAGTNLDSTAYYQFGAKPSFEAFMKSSQDNGIRFASVRVRQNDYPNNTTSSASISAYDAGAAITLNEIRIDTAGIAINTRGGVGNGGDILTSNGTKSYWAAPLIPGGGTLSADQLSYNPVAGYFEAVNANRSLVTFVPSGTDTASEGDTDIIIDTTATTTTINLNFTPGLLLDGVSYTDPLTTVRYITNWGSGACTVQTNQSWLFKTSTTTSGTLTIGAGESYKLIWRSNATPANARFYCIKLQ